MDLDRRRNFRYRSTTTHEHVCDYLNRLNGYARNAGVQFEKGGRESKEHVNRFLESCGDRGLERCLCHLRVKEIHELRISSTTSSSRRNKARLEKPLRTSPEDETALTVVMSGVQRPRGTDIDGTVTTDTDADMTVEWTTPVTAPHRTRESLSVRDDGRAAGPRVQIREVRTLEVSVHASEPRGHRIVMSRPPTTLNAEPRQSGRTADLRTAAVAETSLTEGSTATPATKALTDVVVSVGRVRHAGVLTTPPTTVSSVVPIGLPQLASPPVDADCVYAFVGESKWLKTQRREEVKEVNTTEIEKERNGSFGGGESDERKTEEWNSGCSEGWVSSVTQKTWHDYQPENVIQLLSGERLGW
ncbi:unnamed protein product [Phytophthora fragariaefolia]|uniref:Unnamed protein product n=1 Tax=Phytophthora fragariaefolia TaxID=1490495 RepID=A0A9W6XDG1_9STRA|nr:unnamed protein product [Phytophthora fragariaefolia]